MFGQGLDVKKAYIVMLICFPVNKELSLPLSLPLYVRLCLSLCLSVSVSLSLSLTLVLHTEPHMGSFMFCYDLLLTS